MKCTQATQCILTAFLLYSSVRAQSSTPAACVTAMQQPPYIVSDGQGRLYSQLTLSENFSTDALLPALHEFTRRLQTLGIELVAVPVPWAAMIYFPDQLIGAPGTFNYSPSLARLGYQQVVANFRKAGINTTDLLTTFLAHQNQDLYFKTDHHWKLPAVELAARSVTDAVPPTVKQTLTNARQLEEVSPTFQGHFQFLGGFATSVEQECNVAFPLEETFATVALSEPPQSLISDDLPPGVIFGSSFSRSVTTNQGTNPYALGYGFEQWLTSLLHISFQNESISGGSQTSILEFFRDSTNLTGRRLAIWEFPISDFAAENLDHNLTFLAQMMARLSRIAYPDERPIASGHSVLLGNKVSFTFDPLASTDMSLYFQLKLDQPTSLSPVIDVQGEQGEVQLDLRRDGNKLIQTKEFLAQVPDRIGQVRKITVSFPILGNVPVVLEGSKLQLFKLK